MAKKSAIENNLRKQRLAKKFAPRRKRLLDIANDETRPMEERFEARIRLAALPRNGAIIRVRNRCEVTGPAARLLSQGENVAHRASRIGQQRPHPRPRQVELVRRAALWQ